MGKIDYKAIYDKNKHGWFDMTEDPQKYEALLAGHYSDSNHFVYELLQNAEDAFERESNGTFNPKTCAHASKVVIEYYKDKLVFYHNGKPFDEADARGVSSMLMGTKDRDDAQTIGRFGMGFKSVFKYTYQPEIYSDEEAFKITRYLLPVEISNGWNYEEEKKSIACKLGNNNSFMPFINEKHLTKIVIPFLKYGKNGELVSVPGDDVLKKLDGLNGEILLFLTHIQDLYWVNKENGKFAHITLKQDEADEKLLTCRIEGTDYGEKEEISRYLKFKKVFNHPDMENAEVSVAYKLNSRADNINEVEESAVWVYFPTRDETDLPFLIHGSFETAVSREKLMTPSNFNNDLFEQLGDLIAESMVDLAKRKLITQVFLRRCIIAAFDDEENNDTIPGLKEKITKVIKENGLLPNINGEYRKPEELLLPIPFRMNDFWNKPLIGEIFEENKEFVAFNNEREANFTDYFNWLVQDLGIQLYKLSSLALDLKKIADKKIIPSSEEFEILKDFYDFLSDNRESVYSTGLSYSRSGSYEAAIRQDIKNAWVELRKAPIILNRLNKLVPAEIDEKPSIYLGASSEYKSVMQSALVNTSIASEFGKLLTDGFYVQEFNNFQYIKEKVLAKYIEIEKSVKFENQDEYEVEYVEDLQQIIALVDQIGDATEVKKLLRDAYIIKVKPEDSDDGERFARPKDCYLPTSDEGIDLDIYYAPVLDSGLEEDDINNSDNWSDCGVYAIDREFYAEHGISLIKLSKLGLITTPVTEGERRMNGIGDNYWFALGEYCPNIQIDFLYENIGFIEEYPEMDLAKEKSVEVFKLLLKIAEKLQGRKRKRLRNPYDGELEEVYELRYCIKTSRWLFDKEMTPKRPRDISRYELNSALYGEFTASKHVYEILGFIENEIDGTEETLQKAQKLNRQDKMRLLNWLAKDLGKQVSDYAEDDWDQDDASDEVFNPNSWQDEEFPIKKVNNIDYLVRHVREQFYCADPTTYRKVWRQIRVSKNVKTDKSYAIGMYTNSSNTRICQMCKKPIAFVEVNQIANFGIEMPQLNLCLCRECSAKYKAMSMGGKEDFKKNVKAAILSIDASEYSEDYGLIFSDDMMLHFTQTHIAEIQEIFRLLDEYGTPSQNVDDDFDNSVSGPLLHSSTPQNQVAADAIRKITNVNLPEESSSELYNKDYSKKEDVALPGCFVKYRKIFNDEIVDIVFQPEKYPLHKAFLGHKVGDIIYFLGKKYEIVEIK